MKKTKKTLLIITLIITLFLNIIIIKAENDFPSSITMGNPQYVWNNSNKPNGYSFFPYKSTSNGIPAICTSFALTEPANGTICTKTENVWSEPISAGVAAIIEKANIQQNASPNNLNYYYAEIAVNRFLYEYNGENRNNRVYGGLTTSELLGNYYSYFTAAENAFNKVDSIDDVTVTLTRTGGKSGYNLNFDDSNNIVNTYKISGDAESYKVTYEIANQTSDSITVAILDMNNNSKTTFNSGDSFKVKVNGINAGDSANIKIKVEGTVTYKVAAQYSCGNSYQPVTINMTKSKEKKSDVKTTISIKKNNEPNYPTLLIKKEDNNHQTLPGVEISVTKDEQPFEKLYTDTGNLELNDLEEGSYCIQETKAPNGYVINSNKYCFDVEINENIASVILRDAYFTKSNTTPEKITFTLPNNPNRIRISKKDNNGNFVSGAKLVILDKNKERAKDVFGNEIEEIITSDSPTVLRNIGTGVYYLREIEAPNGYTLKDHDVRFNVKNNRSYQDNTEVYSADVVMTNKKTVLNISKIDITDKKELKGAKLRILDENCQNVIKLDGHNLQWESDETAHTITGLPAGKYCLEETSAPAGYKLMTEKIKFELTNYGVVKVNNEASETATVVMNNEPYKIYISKKSLTDGEEIAGAHLQVIDENGIVVEEWDSTTTSHLIKTKLAPGTYTLKETIAPDGFVLSEETISFKVDKYGKVTVNNKEAQNSTVIMTNDYTKVYISKQDITTKQELPGAHLILKNEKGEVVKDGDWISGEEPHLIEGLGKGTYTLTEITAPDGYSLSEETITFTIDENGVVSGDTIMYNTPIPDVPQTFSAQSILFIIIGVVLVGSGVGLYIYGIKKKKEI